jgi:hypothetical protein
MAYGGTNPERTALAFVKLCRTPLAVEQRSGITAERVAEIYSRLEHRLH